MICGQRTRSSKWGIRVWHVVNNHLVNGK